MNRSNIVLIGFMGTGKSTVGKLLSERLGWTFRDTDHRIEEQYKMTVAEIFKVHGEAYFRMAESRTLAEVLSNDHQVIATGGGAVLAAQNRERMLEDGYVVALTAASDVIIQRVSSDQSRPLLQGNLEERVHAILEHRRNAYDFAHMKIDTSNLSTEEIAELILKNAGLSG